MRLTDITVASACLYVGKTHASPAHALEVLLSHALLDLDT